MPCKQRAQENHFELQALHLNEIPTDLPSTQRIQETHSIS